MAQDTVFIDGEADRWFERNREVLTAEAAADRDPVLRLLTSSGLRPARSLEVGAANGFRLEAIRRAFGGSVTGVDPSAAAVADGRRRYPQVRYVQGVAHRLDGCGDDEFDLVIVAFVLHWVDRSRLLASVAETDRVLADGGHLIIADFLPAAPHRVKYHHLPNEDVWTYKQDYAALWEASNLYRVIERRTLDYETKECSDRVAPENRIGVALLRKELRAGYRVGTFSPGPRGEQPR